MSYFNVEFRYLIVDKKCYQSKIIYKIAKLYMRGTLHIIYKRNDTPR